MLNWGAVDRILWMGVLSLVTWSALMWWHGGNYYYYYYYYYFKFSIYLSIPLCNTENNDELY
jgi:hypothetical protein